MSLPGNRSRPFPAGGRRAPRASRPPVRQNLGDTALSVYEIDSHTMTRVIREFVERVPRDYVSAEQPHRRVLLRRLLPQNGAREHRVVAAAFLAQLHLTTLLYISSFPTRFVGDS
ncbi:hypothetical protein MSG28_004776 [Choristoneura fumiferana]|uniref:Uncharacterized protein n=1 Tax=Choristoneura fumiferana TaxID=7141 RepID=A0ACC0K7K9_CHOFU|nr:hypothetical protein MSG28_004776 [Choristoneura fumiferana]